MKRSAFFIIIAICLVVLILHILYKEDTYIKTLYDLNLESESEGLNVNKSFSFLEEAVKKNGDVYAWIKIPKTAMSFPVVQHSSNDKYYLTHDSEKYETIYGAIFTEKYNKRDFNSKMTIIYGHAMRDGSMFGELKKFKDKDFFDEHDTIEIYYDHQIYRYKIIAVYKESNEHILSKYDLSSKEKFEKYYFDVKKKALKNGGYYRKYNKEVNRMLTLSTCNSAYDDKRWIVQSVLERIGGDK